MFKRDYSIHFKVIRLDLGQHISVLIAAIGTDDILQNEKEGKYLIFL